MYKNLCSCVCVDKINKYTSIQVRTMYTFTWMQVSMYIRMYERMYV